MGQRGSIRIESGSYFGYYNTYLWEEKNGELTKVRKQKCVKLGKAEGLGKLSKWDAQEALAKEIEKASGTSADRPVRDGSITLEQFAKTRWLPLREGSLRSGSKDSLNQRLVHIYRQFGSQRLDELDKVEMQSWLNRMALDYSDGMIKHLKFYLRSILEEAVDQEYLPKNPAKKLELPRTKRVSKDVLTEEQFRAVLVELESPYDLIAKVGIACGLRPSELLALRWRDLDVETKTFMIRETIYRGELRPYTKTTEEGEPDKSLLSVPVPDALVEELIAYRGLKHKYQDLTKKYEGKQFRIVSNDPLILDFFVKDDDFIFHNLENGNFLSKENILYRIFDPLEKRLGLKLNFQVLRRTSATQGTAIGTVKDVQGLLRHRNPDISMGEYAQVIPESTRAMVNTMYATLTTAKKSSKAAKSSR